VVKKNGVERSRSFFLPCRAGYGSPCSIVHFPYFRWVRNAMATGKNKMGDAEQVAAFMSDLDHPLKQEIEKLREIIKSTSSEIQERIKWNAPSYYCGEDMLTFGPMRKTDQVMLVFHHPYIVEIASDLLEGTFKDRRLAYFKNMAEIEANSEELQRIIRRLLLGMKK
jgi:uncharacterized protein YdhG (YjbR/CyaY superfamily)